MARQQNQNPILPTQKVLMDFSGGFSVEKPSVDLEENQFTELVNLQFFKNSFKTDTGFRKYRQSLNSVPQAQFQFVFTNGAVQTLLLTQKFLYLDNGIAWVFVGDGIYTGATTVQANAGSNTFQLSTVADLNVGDAVGITLDDTTQLQTTINAINGTQILCNDPVPQGRIAPNGTAVVRPQRFNGSAAFQPVGVTWPNTNTFYFTNGIDPICTFNGEITSPSAGWAGITCRVLVAFHEMLIAMDTTEGGTRFPQRARNSDVNNPDVTAGGLAGFVDLTDTEDFILAADVLGPWLIIYREESVMRRSYIGDALQLFFDEYTLTGVGVFSQNSVADTGSSHVIAGPSGIFRYTGGYDVEDVGGPIFDYLIGPQGILNLSQIAIINCFYVSELDEVWLMVPTGSNAFLDTLLRLNQEFGSWWLRTFPGGNEWVGFGFLTAIAGRSWQEANVSWSSDDTTWLSHAKTVEAPLTLLLSNDGVAQLYDYVTTTDAGIVIPWSFASKDFSSPGMQLRTDGIYARGRGNNILVELSFDEGQSWVNYGTLNFGLTSSKQQVNGQYSGIDVCRFRLSGNDPLFELEWIRFDYYEDSLW